MPFPGEARHPLAALIGAALLSLTLPAAAQQQPQSPAAPAAPAQPAASSTDAADAKAMREAARSAKHLKRAKAEHRKAHRAVKQGRVKPATAPKAHPQP